MTMKGSRYQKVLWMAVLATGATGVLAGGAAKTETTGAKVGEKAAPFELKDQDGKILSLDQLRRKGLVALVFYRSADW